MLLSWLGEKTGELQRGARPEALGDTVQATTALLSTLRQFTTAEKPPKENEKVGLCAGLHEVAQRRAEEGREAPPPIASELESSWATMEKAAAELQALPPKETHSGVDAGGLRST